MRLSNFTDYSLRVLIFLNLKEDELSTVGEIADKYQISRNHLVKVVHNLSLMGIIKSYKGKGGGIALNLSPEKINIRKLVKDLESDSNLVECFDGNGKCIISPACKLKSVLKQAQKNFYDTLSQYSLADITTNKVKLLNELRL
ncbi:Rrf2 family transcriptional regulator [Bacteriovoracaceae bacterium]|nr:Rrf2 family transcriptional regulator [Bacteriovoracaceae bacterium]